MKELKENFAALSAYATADTRNAENFPAWTMGDSARLEQLAMTGTLGNSFYASAKGLTRDALQLLERADASALARAIVHGRQEGFIRTFPILGLLYLSQKDAGLFQEVFQQVILTGNDLGDFIDLTRRHRGFGRSIKRAIGDWLRTKTTPYYAMKYRKQLADAIRISRFRGTDPIYAYILDAYSNVKGMSAEKLESAYQNCPELAARRHFLELLEAGKNAEAAQVLREAKLDVDSLTAYYDRFDSVIWSAVAERTPVMRFLKYLAKFARERVDLEQIAAQKLTVDNLKRAKVFPFRLYTAYKGYMDALPDVDREFKAKPFAEALGGPEEKASEFPVLSVGDTIAKVLNDYADQYDWSDFTPFRWVIAPDMSGSMTSPIGNGNISYATVSGMFTAFFNRAPLRVDVLPWNTEVMRYNVPRFDSVISQINAVTNAVDGGTYMEAPVLAMLSRQIDADYSVFLTDSMEYGSGWFPAWKKYRKSHPHAQAFVIRLDSYGTSPIPEAEAAQYGVWQIFGWSDSVIEFMRYVIKEKRK